MNRDRVSSGMAQDPLNYLQRRTVRSTTLSPVVKSHLLILIRKAKLDGPYTSEQATAEGRRLFSYGQTLRLEELIDSLKVSDKGYKAAVWAYSKMSENYIRMRPRSTTSKHGQQAGNGQPRASALWQGKVERPVPPAPDAETA